MDRKTSFGPHNLGVLDRFRNFKPRPGNRKSEDLNGSRRIIQGVTRIKKTLSDKISRILYTRPIWMNLGMFIAEPFNKHSTQNFFVLMGEKIEADSFLIQNFTDGGVRKNFG